MQLEGRKYVISCRPYKIDVIYVVMIETEQLHFKNGLKDQFPM